jgi:tetratricopeptide (TPR) repeat protein
MASSRKAARLAVLLAAAAGTAGPAPAPAFANVAVGERIDPVVLRTADGRSEPLVSAGARVNVFVFFRPRHDHSLETLKALAGCEVEFAEKGVRWVAVVSAAADPGDVRQAVEESGIRMPVLLDPEDRVYGKLGVRLHPVVGIADGQLRLVAYEPFMKINYCDRIRARVRFLLGEIGADDLRRVEAPEKATMPGEVEGAARKRRLNLAEMLLRAKQYGKAEGEARRVLEADPKVAAAWVLLGDALAGQGKCPEATKAWGEALALEPGNAGAKRGPEACAVPR